MPPPAFFQALKRRVRSFGYAFQGIKDVVRSQPNMRIHLLAAGTAIGLGLFWGLERWEWCILALTIALVMAAEAFNTAIEYLTDLVSPQHHPLAGRAKDAAAAAVLICSVGALLVGLLLFGHRLLA